MPPRAWTTRLVVAFLLGVDPMMSLDAFRQNAVDALPRGRPSSAARDDGTPPPAAGAATLLVALVKSLEEVTPAVWRSLGSWCASRKIVVSILYLAGSPSLVEHHLQHCHADNVTVIRQKDAEQSIEYQGQERSYANSRIARLGMLRSWQRQRLRRHLSATVPLDAVVVVDLDVLTLPADRALSRAIATVRRRGRGRGRGSGRAEDVVCANGYEEWLFHRHYYDTFALVAADGTWGFPVLTCARAVVGRRQHQFYEEVREKGDGNHRVQSCFGGLAVYDVAAFFNTECDYRVTAVPGLVEAVRRYSNGDGEACEHVIFHTCLGLVARKDARATSDGARDEGGTFKIAIQPDLQLSRSPAIGGWNNATLVHVVISLLLLTGCVAVCRVRSPYGRRGVRSRKLRLRRHFGISLKNTPDPGDSDARKEDRHATGKQV